MGIGARKARNGAKGAKRGAAFRVFRVLSLFRDPATATDHVSNAASVVARTSIVRVTKHYAHGGARVALRAEGVVQYLHSDHLGSLSLITNHESRITAQQRFLPYGGVRWSDGTFPTDVGFTGHRGQAELGLIFMRARYYHSGLGRFVSADTVVPEPGNPQSLNRFAYVLGNPLRFTDPSGHIAKEEYNDAMHIIRALLNYGVYIEVDFGWQPVMSPAPGEPQQTWVEGVWKLAELETVWQGVKDLAGVMGGAEGFRQNLGGISISKKEMAYAGLVPPLGWNVYLNAGGFSKWTVVHELAHAWDRAHGWQLSRRMEAFVGAETRGILRWFGIGEYDWRPGPPPKGADQNFNRFEDFAESVTTFVYPDEARRFIQDRFRNVPDFHYDNYYRTQRAVYVAMQLNMDPFTFVNMQRAGDYRW